MSGYVFSDNELKNAAALVRGSMLNSLSASGEPGHEFTPAFENNMQRLISRTKIRRNAAKILQGAAAVFFAALVGVAAWLAVDIDARATVIRWFRELFEDEAVYHFEDEVLYEQPEHNKYVLSWLPEGFEVTVEYQGLTCVACYENGEGDGVIFSYSTMNGVLDVNALGDELKTEKVKINSITADYYYGDDISDDNVLVWIDEEAGVIFSINSNLDKSVILHIAEGVALAEMTK